MEQENIIDLLKSGALNPTDALELLAADGSCPNLLNDDNGHWALSFDGFQNMPEGEGPQDISTTSFVEAKSWKDTIREAVLFALECNISPGEEGTL